MVRSMKTPVLLLAVATALGLGATSASAACTATYKAKRDNPLELYFETIEISGACTVAAASAELRARLAERGLTLLKVLSVQEH